jgi:hypothetical protein
MTDVLLPEVFADVLVEHYRGHDEHYVVLFNKGRGANSITQLKNVWPLFTDEERRLVIGASLMRTQGENTTDVFIGKQEVTLWFDGEVWINLPVVHNKVKEVVQLQRERDIEAKRAANT